jgi:hypothetical protein
MKRAQQLVADLSAAVALWLCAWAMGDVTWPSTGRRRERALSCLLAIAMGLGFAAALAHGLDVL